MFRLLRLTLALIVTFAAVIFAARLIGRTQPSPVASLFTNPDGKPCERPCLFGIQPGKTTHEEALNLLKAHPLTGEITGTTAPLSITGRGALSGKNVMIYLSPEVARDNDLIKGVELWLQDWSSSQKLPIASLGDFAILIERPKEFGWDFFGYLYLQSTNFSIRSMPHENRSPFNTQVILIDIREPESATFGTQYRWCGFTVQRCR